MAEYIEREAFLARMKRTGRYFDVKHDIENFPAADVAPVVHCRECEYAKNAKWNKKGYRICPASHMEITDDDFCSYGVRKEEVLSCERET